MSTMTTSTNPYGGMDDSSPGVEREESEVFRGSRSYENGLSEVAEGSDHEQVEIMAAQPREQPRISNETPVSLPCFSSLDSD